MNSDIVVGIVTAVSGLIAGGGLVKLLTVKAEKEKILGDSSIARANSEKTYHEMAMEMVEEYREQFKEMKADLTAAEKQLKEMRYEMGSLNLKVRELNFQLEEKDRIIEAQRAEIAALKGAN